MSLFLFRFWPVLLPLLIYVIWLKTVAKRKAVAEGREPPKFRDGPLYWLAFATLAVGLVCVLLLGVESTSDAAKGEYVPPRLEDGRLVPGHIRRDGE